MQHLESQSFDCVLMDIEMPGMGGLETTEAIRKKEEYLNYSTPIIALSAHTDRNEEFLRSGVDACLSKPIDRGDLIEQLAKLTSR